MKLPARDSVAWLGLAWRRGRRLRRSGFQRSTAVRAKPVAKVHAALTVRAGWSQPGATAGTETEAGLCFGAALRTATGAGLAQNEIEDDAEAVGDKDGNQGPEEAAHAASSGVLVDVANQHGVAAGHRSGEGSEQHANQKRRGFVVHAQDGHKREHGHEDQGE